MQVEPRNYASYLLRLRQVEQDGQRVWRASLESIQTGEHERFVDVGALVDFLLNDFGTVTMASATPELDTSMRHPPSEDEKLTPRPWP